MIIYCCKWIKNYESSYVLQIKIYNLSIRMNFANKLNVFKQKIK